MKFSIEAIAIVHSCYSEKFGIPRQPGLVKSAKGCIEMLPPYDREENGMMRNVSSFQLEVSNLNEVEECLRRRN